MSSGRRERRGMAGLLAAVGTSILGTRMSFLALPWFVLASSGNPTAVGLVAAAEMGPYVLAQALGGPLVDRCGAWRISVGTDAAAAVVLGAIPLLYRFDALPVTDRERRIALEQHRNPRLRSWCKLKSKLRFIWREHRWIDDAAVQKNRFAIGDVQLGLRLPPMSDLSNDARDPDRQHHAREPQTPCPPPGKADHD